MTQDEARAKYNELRGGSFQGGPAAYKAEVDALYYAVCGKHLPNCKCKDRVNDAMIEIYIALKNPQFNEVMKKTAKLVQGVALLHVPGHDGKVYNNTNLTDEVARAFLTANPDKKTWFEVLPAEEEKNEAPAEVKKTRKSTKK